jgi:hypothetical protein
MKIRKSESAIIQLKAAIYHYDNADYISALTLAAASSEIFISLCQARNLSIKRMIPAERLEELNQQGINLNKRLKIILNKNRNELKHHESDEDYEIEGEFWRDALGFISDSVENYRILFGHDLEDEVVSNFMDKTFKG